MNQFEIIYSVLMFLLTSLQFLIASKSLNIQQSTNKKIESIDKHFLSERDIQIKVLNEIAEDMDDLYLSIKVAEVLERAYFRRIKMGVDPNLDSIFNESKNILVIKNKNI